MTYGLRPALLLFSAGLPLACLAQPATPTSSAAGTPATQTAGEVAPAPRRFEPAYPVQYQPASVEQITAVMDRVLGYLETATPASVVDLETRQPVADISKLPARPMFARGDFLLVSYEWGVTYASMLHAAEVLKNDRYKQYVAQRVDLIRTLADHYRANPPAAPANAAPGERRWMRFPLRSVIAPASLDDSGAMAAAMIKAHQAGAGPELRPLIDNYLGYISNHQQRFDDGTLSRNRPLPNSLWLDDLYMSVPALAQMGKLTGDTKYFDDAVRQILQFADRMFVREAGLYMHGWVQGMEPHPVFHWGRANGWAVMAKVELLSVLPESHPGHAKVLELLRAHLRGLAATQGINGLWHQLLDRSNTYEETSASAMFVYGMARAINRGWVDPLVYGPAASLGWNAVAQKVNERGQVEGTCIGTGMGWEPTFYAYRPTSVYAAHGYGPVLHAGAEMVALRRGAGAKAVVHDGGVHFGESIPDRRR